MADEVWLSTLSQRNRDNELVGWFTGFDKLCPNERERRIGRAVAALWFLEADDLFIGYGDESSLQAGVRDTAGKAHGVIGLWPHKTSPATIHLHFTGGGIAGGRCHPALDDPLARQAAANAFQMKAIEFAFAKGKETDCTGMPKIVLADLAVPGAIEGFHSACRGLFQLCRTAVEPAEEGGRNRGASLSGPLP